MHPYEFDDRWISCSTNYPPGNGVFKTEIIFNKFALEFISRYYLQ